MGTFPKLKNKAVLSPMSGVTDVAFRALARTYGAGLTYTEFVNSTGIVRGNVRALDMLKTDDIESPVAVQLFGSSMQDIIDAAKSLENQFDIIDMNCGCPAWKVIKTGAGSALLNNPEKIASFVNKVASSVRKPVTIKIRTGIDDRSINAVDIARIAQDAGAAAIAVHGRTQQQGYSGEANWQIIKQVKDAVDIPVIGNGDVFSPETFKRRLDESNVDAIMIARGAIGNPHIFAQIDEFLKTGAYEKMSGLEQFANYLEFARKHNIQESAIKSQAISFTKGMVGGAKVREQLVKCESIDQISKILEAVN